MRSNFTGRCSGMSAGFVPRKRYYRRSRLTFQVDKSITVEAFATDSGRFIWTETYETPRQTALRAARPAEPRAADRRQPEMATAAIQQEAKLWLAYLARSMIERTSMLPRRANGILEATSTAS